MKRLEIGNKFYNQKNKEKLREVEWYISFFVALCSTLWYYIYRDISVVVYVDRLDNNIVR